MPDTPDPSFDLDSATVPLSGPRPTLSGSNVDLPLPEELTKLLPAGAYEITGFLGAGGMGAVYKGTQVRLKRPVAIKIMRRDMGKDHDFEARFEREAQAMAKLNHPNIVSVIDYGEAGPDYLYIVMELVDGTDLMDVIRSKQITQEMALALLPQICDALQFAHDHGIVHRDIKPSNIMLTRDGRVKMADFGLAKHFDHADSGFRTQTGTGMGTPDYAAPEQFDPTTQIDHRADIYALGVMIYQMITGALPRGVWKPPSQRAPVSTQWDAVVSRAMQNDPAERYQHASDVKTDVSSIPLIGGRAAAPSAAASGPAATNQPNAALAGASALPKSRAPLLVGTIVIAIAAFIGVFFALHKPDEGRAAVPPSATSVPAAANRTKTVLAGASALPSSATKDAPFVNSLGMKFVPVPGTQVLFSIWDTRVMDYSTYAVANPKVDGTWKTQQKDGVPRGREPDHPVVGVSWDDAQAFCQWLTEKETAAGKLAKGAKYRLPTDAEWSTAVGLPPEQGATPEEKNAHGIQDAAFPWGNVWPPTKNAGNYADETFHDKFPPNEAANEEWLRNKWLSGYTDGFAATSPVGAFPANAYGLYDMGGNVWQWCEDSWAAEHKDRVQRGGCWSTADRYSMRSSARSHLVPTGRRNAYGFRCVLEHAPSASALPGSKPSSPIAGPLEPGAIRLWDAQEKLPSTLKGISWKEDALFIHSTVMAVRVDNKPLTYRDSIVRFSLRMNRDAQWANLILRDSGTPAAPRQYKLSINPPTGVIKFIVADGGTERDLKSWPLPRQYAPEEWLRVELRSVGDDFTVSLDGQPLETVHDTTLPNRGLAHFGASANAYFRDIIYVPLDKPAAVSPAPSLPVSASASSATKDTPFINTLGMKFVPVPITGGPTDKQRVLFSVWETRVQDYEAFAKETKRAWPKPDFEQGPTHPAVNVNWDDAAAYCAWLTEREHKAGRISAHESYRLPTDHEWSCAAGIGDKEDAAKLPGEKDGLIADAFPWGTQWPPPEGAGNYAGEELQPLLAEGKYSTIKSVITGYRDGFQTTAAVGSFAANRLGLYDLGGNAWQWCADWYDDKMEHRVLRGAAWDNFSRSALLAAKRAHLASGARDYSNSFRCVLALSAPAGK